MLERDILLGGEESGGIGTKLYLPERDATVSALLLAEVMAWHGKSLGELVAHLHAEFGEHHYGRVDLELKPGQKERAIEYFSPRRPAAKNQSAAGSIGTSLAAKIWTASNSTSASQTLGQKSTIHQRNSAGSWSALPAPKTCSVSTPKPPAPAPPAASSTKPPHSCKIYKLSGTAFRLRLLFFL